MIIQIIIKRMNFVNTFFLKKEHAFTQMYIIIRLFSLSSEISKTEFLLKEYMKYGLFLLKLSPKHWQVQQALKRLQMSKSKENINGVLPKKLPSESHILNFH